MKIIKQNLSYIEKSLLNNTHKEQGAIIHLMLEETVQEVKDLVFQYEIPYSSQKATYHVFAFVKRSKKAKASLLCDLRELQTELNRKNINVKRCLVVIQKALQTNLYQDEINRSINKWVNIGNNPTRSKIITVE